MGLDVLEPIELRPPLRQTVRKLRSTPIGEKAWSSTWTSTAILPRVHGPTGIRSCRCFDNLVGNALQVHP